MPMTYQLMNQILDQMTLEGASAEEINDAREQMQDEINAQAEAKDASPEEADSEEDADSVKVATKGIGWDPVGGLG